MSCTLCLFVRRLSSEEYYPLKTDGSEEDRSACASDISSDRMPESGIAGPLSECPNLRKL